VYEARFAPPGLNFCADQITKNDLWFAEVGPMYWEIDRKKKQPETAQRISESFVVGRRRASKTPPEDHLTAAIRSTVYELPRVNIS